MRHLLLASPRRLKLLLVSSVVSVKKPEKTPLSLDVNGTLANSMSVERAMTLVIEGPKGTFRLA